MITKLAVENSLYHWFNSILIDENDFSVITTVDGKVDRELAMEMFLSQLIIAHLWWKMFFFFFHIENSKSKYLFGARNISFQFSIFFSLFLVSSIFYLCLSKSNFYHIVILWCLRIIIWVNYTHLPSNMLKYTLHFLKM